MPSPAPSVVDLTSSPAQDRSTEARRLKRSRTQYETSVEPAGSQYSQNSGEPHRRAGSQRPRDGPLLGSSNNINLQQMTAEDEDYGTQEVLQRRQMEQIDSQKNDESERTFKKNQCSICLDRPTDQTSTPCGHVFCHMCIIEALKAGEAQGPKKSRCPVCRQSVKRSSLIVLELKLGSKAPSGG